MVKRLVANEETCEFDPRHLLKTFCYVGETDDGCILVTTPIPEINGGHEEWFRTLMREYLSGRGGPLTNASSRVKSRMFDSCFSHNIKNEVETSVGFR